MDAAPLQARITALELALDRHELEVEFADRRVRYASTSEILDRIDYYQKQLRNIQGRPRQFSSVSGKGLCA